MKRRKNSYFKYFSLFFTMIVLVLIAGCNGTAPIINSFSANPLTITVGGSSTLSWSVTDATSVTIDNGIGSVALTGTTIVTPATTTTYTLTATNAAGSVTGSVTVTVGAAYGSIDINSTPTGATVYLDGVDTGSVTPVTLINKAVGNHTIKLTKHHYKNKEEVVTVIADQTINVNLPLTYAPEETITIQPGGIDGKDAYVYDNSPTINYGNSGGLVIGTSTGLNICRSYLQFDLSSVPPTAVILYARLMLYYSWSWPNTPFYISLYEVEESWGEDTITWDNQPASSAVEEVKTYIPGSATNDFRYWYINDLVKGWYDGSISNYGMVLRDTDESTVESQKTFSSSDHWDASMRPILEIDYYLP